MRWLKALFRPKTTVTPIQKMTSREVEAYILNSLAKGERPPDSAVDRFLSHTARKQAKNQMG